MKVVTQAEMRGIDTTAQENYKIPGSILMERAALALREQCLVLLGKPANKRVVIICGKGNNGGDGLALARLLLEEKTSVTAVLAFEPDRYRGSAGENLERAEKFGVRIIPLSTLKFSEMETADLVVDALLGTGASGVPTGAVAEAISLINRSGKPVLAIDLPSGIDADTGNVPGEAVQAIRTVTFGLPKPGLLLYPGASYAGILVTASIGFPGRLIEDQAIRTNYLTPDEIRDLLPSRSVTAHKGTTGHVLVIGGATGMTGAPVLSSLAAFRTGCGLVTVALRPGLCLYEKPVEVMSTTWADVKLKGNYRCILFGVGLSPSPDGLGMLRRLREETEVPLVIDADGLNLLAGHADLRSGWNRPVIFTPHPGEMVRLTGMTAEELERDRLGIARKFAREWGVIVVFKGARTVTAWPDGTAYINMTGNPGMATAGMGDVLAGIIASLVAQGYEPGIAAAAGVYLHGRAGDIVAKRRGPIGIIARDVVEEMPTVLGEIFAP